MINFYEVNETQQMIEHENLDVRTITLGISLLDCIDSNLDVYKRQGEKTGRISSRIERNSHEDPEACGKYEKRFESLCRSRTNDRGD